MKKLYLTITAVLACGMLSLGNVNANAQRLDKSFKLSEKSIAKKKVARTSPQIMKTSELIPMPQKEKIINYDIDNDLWVTSSLSTMTYDQNNLTKKENTLYNNDGSIYFMIRNNFTYNEDGNVLEERDESSYDEGETWSNDIKIVYAYDDIRKDCAIMREFYNWDGSLNEWYMDEENEDGYFVELTRDENKRVTKSTTWLNSEMPIALASQEFTYSDKENPTSILWNALNEMYELEPAYVYDNIKWLKSDNQFASIAPNVYYLFEADANNVLKEYTLYTANADGTKGDVYAEFKTTFDDKNRMSTVLIDMKAEKTKYECKYTYDIDENGSFELNDVITLDYDGDGVEDKLKGRMTTTINSHGDIIKEEMFKTDPMTGLEMQDEGYIYDIEYDEYNLVKAITNSYFTEFVDDGSYVYLNKVEYSDYTNLPTAINNAVKKNAEVSICGNSINFKNARGAHYTICDMQGKTVARGVVTNDTVSANNLPKGMYIVKISGKNVNNAVKLLRK